MAQRLTTCTFCGVGCGIYLETSRGRITGAYPSMSHPSNRGRICVRGWNVHEVASSPDRLKTPLIRKHRKGDFEEVSWETAIHYVVLRMKEIRQRYGPKALAFYNSPRCSNEEAYLLQKLARAVAGTNNVDHGTGVYGHNSIQVLVDMLGVAATTNSIAELAQSQVVVVDGVDLALQLPTIGGWIMRARLNGAKLVVIDARRHRLAEQADLFLQLRPGTDVLLYGAMAKVIVDRGLMNTPFIKAHCQDYPAWLEQLREYDLLTAAEICGVDPELIENAAIAYARAPSAALLYSTGSEGRPLDSIRSMVNLALLTGHLGREGAGLYALTEQNNLQGVCDMGMLPDRLPGYRPLSDRTACQDLARLWNAPIPQAPGIGARQLLESGPEAPVKGLWLCRYDPVTTATFCQAASALERLELVVVQHLFMTATAQFADVILPLVAFGEEQVSFTSTERRIQLATQVIEPPIGPRPAWRQLTQIAQAWGADWNFDSSEEVMDEIRQAIPFYGGATYENLAREYGRQWPCPREKPLGTKYLFEDGIPDKAFKFAPVAKPPAGHGANSEYPLALIFGHSLYYWHQNILVKHSETLKRELSVLLLDYPEGFVEMSPEDAQSLQVRDGERIRIVSEDGTALTTARISSEIRQGTIFLPFFLREVEQQILSRAVPEAGLLGNPVHVRIEKTNANASHARSNH